LDEFFRRGDDYSSTPNSLEPPMGVDIAGGDIDPSHGDRALRSPEQMARRAKYIRYVSATMGVLVTGLVLVFANQALARHRSTARESGDFAAMAPLAANPSVVERNFQSGVSGAQQQPFRADSVSASETHAHVAPPPQEVAVAARPVEAATERALAASESGSAPAAAETHPSPVVEADSKPERQIVPSSAARANSAPAEVKAALMPRLAAGATKTDVSRAKSPSAARGEPRLVARASVARTPLAKTSDHLATAKPSDYKPPTASFSD
jgi:hypothetical protein